MTAHAVHWNEGMFLRPQHFQAAQRHFAEAAQTGLKWDLHYNWGLRGLDLDLDALGNHRFVVRGLRARLRDGTQVRVPEDAALPALDLRAGLEKKSPLTVHLALPLLRLGKANVAGAGEEGRYQLSSQDLEDENTGLNPQPVQVRLLNLRLLLSTEDLTGYEVLELARLERSSEADARPQLSPGFIPAVLACDAWPPLQAGLLQSIHDRIGQKIDLLANQVESRGIAVESQTPQDALVVNQLRALNEAYALLSIQHFALGVHPLVAYLELCRLVGKLAIYGDTFRPPALSPYDHDNLGGCFFAVKRYLDGLLDRIIEPEYKVVPFEGHGLRMEVGLEPAWLEAAWEMYVGVKSTLSSEDCVALLTRSGQLDMKIGSAGQVDRIFQRGQAGLRFIYAAQPPRALPRLPGQIYFQINREAQAEEWKNVQRSLTLAIRLNETRVEGSIEGQRSLTIRTGPQTTTLQFALYVVRASH
jgi:type VI secretion system protein ImpJ